ncbi:hypothetical protein ACOZE3_28355 [Streptomyces cinereoruber]|uniref:hypothetical protein n=1 Tax=Streptomyces cinereoruber TaxID=67260 RepID=UPI003BF52AF0
MTTDREDGEERRVREAVRQHARNSAFGEAEKTFSAVLSDPGIRAARARVETAEKELGTELCARLQPLQDHYNQAVAEGDADLLARVYSGWVTVRAQRMVSSEASMPMLKDPVTIPGPMLTVPVPVVPTEQFTVRSATSLPCDSIVACTLPSPSHATVNTVGRRSHAQAETTPPSPVCS